MAGRILCQQAFISVICSGRPRGNLIISPAHENVHPENRNDKKQHDGANSVTVQAQDMSRHVADPREELQHQPQGDSDELSIHPRITQDRVQQPLPAPGSSGGSFSEPASNEEMPDNHNTPEAPRPRAKTRTRMIYKPVR